MKGRQVIRNTLVKMAALVFVLNTIVAYGACCFVAPANGAETVPASTLPCHDSAGKENKAGTEQGCCLMCVSLTLPAAVPDLEPQPPAAQRLEAVPDLVEHNIDPPLRPPIRLS